ncbi:anion transporter [Methylocystis sp.]|uniref:anion transporter n=1 Tax=Methylocystis sp. TaxID=1911079 RepID=UPI0025DF2215|nr:anion transporter [Methylocystis sp.]
MPPSLEPASIGARHPFLRFWLGLFATIIVAGGAALAAAAILGVGELLSLLSRLPTPTPQTAAVSAIFAATYLVLAIGKLPYYRLDRAGGALLGASLMIGVGALSLDEAYRAVDFDAITLLLGMMIVVANLRLSGFFRRAADWLADVARRPIFLLAAVAATTGFFSAFLVNDAICLVMPPLVVDLAQRLKRDPTPYVLSIPLASNVGSVATITGNPQNMIIATASGISYGDFTQALWPIALSGVALTILFVALAFPREFFSRDKLTPIDAPPRPYHRALASKVLLITAAMIALFFAGVPPAKAAIVAGGLLLLTRRVGSRKIYREIDWPLLLMFAGLFIVVGAFDKAVLTPGEIAEVGRLRLDDASTLALVSAVLSNIVSNVPAVLALKPFIIGLSDPKRAWLIVAMASTLAGNFTLVGSIANLIVVERARSLGVRIGFWTYFKVGAPLTIATIALGLWRL